MSVGILLVTHPGIGNALLNSALRIIVDCPLRTMCLEVPLDASIEKLGIQAADMLQRLDEGDGVLILTDIFGATPHNIARRLTGDRQVLILAGLNLPMLVRLFNYPNDDLRGLCNTATTGAIRGIGRCEEA